MGRTLGLPENTKLPRDELMDIKIKIAKGQPIVLDEEKYRDWLDKTMFAIQDKGEANLVEVRALLKKIVDSRPDDATRDTLDLALKKVDEAEINYQHGGIYSNSTHDIHPDLRGTAWCPRVLRPASE